LLGRPTPKVFSYKTDPRYALERTDSFIKVWFWSRTASGIPSEVQNGGGSVDTDNWVSASKVIIIVANAGAGHAHRFLPGHKLPDFGHVWSSQDCHQS